MSDANTDEKAAKSGEPQMSCRALKWWVGREDTLRLRIFESAFTLVFVLMLGFNFTEWRDWLTPEALHLTNAEARALGYPPPFPRMPAWMVPGFGVLILLATAGIVLNHWRRLALITMAIVAVYVQGVDYLSTSAQNKLAIAVFVLLATAPGYRKDPVTGQMTACLAPVRVIQATLLIEYWAAGWTKSFGEGAWLKHADSLQLVIQGFHRTDLAAWFLRTMPPMFWTVGQFSTLVFEIGAPVWFTWKRTRWVAIASGFLLHLGIALLMKNLIFFSAQMWGFYPLFITPEEWRKLGRWCEERFWRRRLGKTESNHDS